MGRSINYHVVLKFDSNIRWKAAKISVCHNGGISVHLFDKHYGHYVLNLCELKRAETT